MNSVESRIAPTTAYYTKAKDMWSFLKKTYSHATNVIKILQLEEELCNIRQGDQDLPQYFATLTAAYERLKALRPPCKHCYASHFEIGMVAKFLSGLSSKYSVAKSQILTGSDLPDLADTYNRLSCLAVTLTQPMHDTPVSALRTDVGTSILITVLLAHQDVVEGEQVQEKSLLLLLQLPHRLQLLESPTCSPSYSLNLRKEEYELVLAKRSTPASTNTAAIDSAFSVGAPTNDPGAPTEKADSTAAVLVESEEDL
ncbi:hypothetical protein EJ110_NYTH56299 [Nymphaea thermarum]|nr:hypothetical protein EJ110_NYTH56299 [Nymphaea thermarum]